MVGGGWAAVDGAAVDEEGAARSGRAASHHSARSRRPSAVVRASRSCRAAVSVDMSEHGTVRRVPQENAGPATGNADRAAKGKLPIKMLNDRILVELEGTDGDRRSSGGILIPATAQVGKRLTWAAVVAIGPNVRSMELNDRVLFNPEDRYEVEVGGSDYIILRERDIHAVAAKRLDDSPTGLYL